MGSRARRGPKKAKETKAKGRNPILFLIPLVLVIAVLVYAFSQPPKLSSIGIGETAPDFELEVVGPNGLTGETARLSSFRGSVVFLEFMVSWCQACRGVAPALESIHQDYQSRGVVLLSVAGTQQGANAESTAAYVREMEVSWTHALDTDNAIFSKYGVEATPTFFVIDKNGGIVQRFQGVVATEKITSALDAALSG